MANKLIKQWTQNSRLARRYKYKVVMRIVLIFLLFISNLSWACDSDSEIELNSFAKNNSNSQSQKIVKYEVFASHEFGDYSLTSIFLYSKDELYVALQFKDAPLYPGYKKSFIEIPSHHLDKYRIYFNYSTLSGDAISLCGNVIEKSLNQLLKAKRPMEVIPAPKSPSNE